MKSILVTLLLGGFLSLIAAAEEKTLSTSPDGAFELVAINHQQPDYAEYVLRDARTKRVIQEEQSNVTYLNSGFGSPGVDWSPDGRMLIIRAKLFRDRETSCAVFRISNDLELLRIKLPDDAEPECWNPDGSLVLWVKRKETYRFDSKKQGFVSSVSEMPGK